MSLRVQFWGTRGSIPSPGSRTVRYGGNTPCVEVRTPDGWLIILDAGTGLRELGRSLLSRANGAPIRGDIFLTHAHWLETYKAASSFFDRKLSAPARRPESR